MEFYHYAISFSRKESSFQGVVLFYHVEMWTVKTKIMFDTSFFFMLYGKQPQRRQVDLTNDKIRNG